MLLLVAVTFPKVRSKNMNKVLVYAMLAVLAFGIISFTPNLGKADEPEHHGVVGGTGTMMRGMITDWGSTPVFGFISAKAFSINVNGTIHERASARAMWSEDVKLNRSDDEEGENEEDKTEPIPLGKMTFTFYIARLVNTTQIAFKTSSFDLDLTGYWDVINVTQTIEFDAEGEPVNCTRTWAPVVANATGELTVIAPHFPTMGTFTLSISGIDPLTGIVFRFRFTDFEIRHGDHEGKGRVDIHDLVRVARGYGSMPGMPRYSEDFDFNFDLRVGIDDLATVAQGIEA